MAISSVLRRSVQVLALVLFAGCATSGGGGDFMERRAAANAEVIKTAGAACDQGDAKACAKVCAADGPPAACVKACDADDAMSCYKAGKPMEDAPRGSSEKDLAAKYEEKGCMLGWAMSCEDGGLMLTHANAMHPAMDGPRGYALYRRGCDIDWKAPPEGIAPDFWMTTVRNSCASAATFAKENGDPDLGRVMLARACLDASPAVCGIYEDKVGFKRDAEAAETAARIAAQRLEAKAAPTPAPERAPRASGAPQQLAPATPLERARPPVCQSYSATYKQQKAANCY